MAVYDLGGTATGSSVALSGLTRYVSASGVTVAMSSVTASPVIVKNSSGRSDGLSSVSVPTVIRISLPMGEASGRAIVTQPQFFKYSLLVGTSTSNAKAEAFHTAKDISESIRTLLPELLKESNTIKALQEAQGIESTRLFSLVEQLVQEYMVDTASAEGITMLEEELGIKPQFKPLLQRKQDIKQRLKQPEILTKQRFKEHLDNYHICSVEERPNEHRVISTILSKRGVPDEITDMDATVDRVLPAHLVHEFNYTWLPWDEIEEVGLTWDQADTYDGDELETAFLIPFSE
jgi:hypothetical protein